MTTYSAVVTTGIYCRPGCGARPLANNTRTFQLPAAAEALPGVEAIQGDTYRRTITVDGAPRALEISPGGDGHLLLRAHLPYWEGLIHAVDRVGRLLGIDTDHAAGVAALSADAVLGTMVGDRPGLAVPGAWSPLEVGVRAILRRGHAPGPVAHWLQAMVTSLGTPVPGLPQGLTPTFPDAEAVTSTSLTAIGLPSAEATAIAGLAATVAAGHSALRYGTSLDALATVPGIDHDLCHHLAFRLGQREAFPLTDPSLDAARVDLGLHPSSTTPHPAPWSRQWRPWLALAAVHLMAHGDTVIHQAERRVAAGREVAVRAR